MYDALRVYALGMVRPYGNYKTSCGKNECARVQNVQEKFHFWSYLLDCNKTW
jgi:hypothetical protein